MASQSANHCASLITEMAHQRSSPRQANTPWGTASGCRLPFATAFPPPFSAATSAPSSAYVIASSCERSMYCPSPVRSRWSSAASSEEAAKCIATQSVYATPVPVGGRSGQLVSPVMPAAACRISPNPRNCACGPYCPSIDIDIMTMSGLIALTAS